MASARLRHGVVVFAIAVSTVGCAPSATPGHTQDPYGLIRSTIQEATVVQYTAFTKGDFMDPPVIDVFLKAGATVEQARDLVCTVVRPAVQGAPLSDEDRRALGVDVWDSAGDHVLAAESDSCT